MSIGLLLSLVQASSASVVYSGVSVLVDEDNNVLVGSGSPRLFGTVGEAGTYSFIDGWGVSSGATTWLDTNGNPAAILDSRGMVVPMRNRIANVSASGSVSITGTPALGAALRESLGPGVNPFVSTFALGSIPFEFSGTAEILLVKNEVTLIEGVDLEVDGSTFAVTVLFGGIPVAFGDVGEMGEHDLLNGWGVEDGNLTWIDTNGDTAAILHRFRLDVPVSGRLANSSIFGVATLSASPTLGFALATEFGVGEFAYSSLVAESLDTAFFIEGRVTVIPEPSTLTLAGLGLIGLLTYGWRRRRRA